MAENVDTDARRIFLKKLLGATGAMVCGESILAAVGEQEPDDSGAGGWRRRLRQQHQQRGGAVDKDYAFVVDIDKCIGCGNCIEACALENGVPVGFNRTWVERYVITEEGVHVDSITRDKTAFDGLDEELTSKALRAAFVPKLCNHCEEAPCVQVCPVGATFNGPGGFVLIDPDHCIGCGYCIQACPYGVRFLNPKTRMADKCTWCYHRVSRGQLPACVTVCPTGARAFGNRNDPDSPVARIFREENWQQLKPEMHSRSRVYYLGLPREVV